MLHNYNIDDRIKSGEEKMKRKKVYALCILSLFLISMIPLSIMAESENDNWTSITTGFEASSMIYAMKVNQPSSIAKLYPVKRQSYTTNFGTKKAPTININLGGISDVQGAEVGNKFYATGDKIPVSYNGSTWYVYTQVAELEVMVEAIPQPMNPSELIGRSWSNEEQAGDNNGIDFDFSKPSLDITQYSISLTLYILVKTSRPNAGLMAVYLKSKNEEFECPYGEYAGAKTDDPDSFKGTFVKEYIAHTNDYDGLIFGWWKSEASKKEFGIHPEWTNWKGKNHIGGLVETIDDWNGDDEFYHWDWTEYAMGEIQFYHSPDSLVSILNANGEAMNSITSLDNDTLQRNMASFFGQRQNTLIEINIKISPAVYVLFLRHWKQRSALEGFSLKTYEKWEVEIKNLWGLIAREKFRLVLIFASVSKEKLSVERKAPSNMTGGGYITEFKRSYLYEFLQSEKGQKTFLLLLLVILILGGVVVVVQRIAKKKKFFFIPVPQPQPMGWI